jgi:hypothetical protein
MPTLSKPLLDGSVADTVYKEITTRAGRYYYFLGKTLTWVDEGSPPLPLESVEYEEDVRRNIIITKEIRPGDVSFVIPRRNWETGTVYDMYDDRISTEVDGVNIIAGGSGYTNSPNVVITGGNGTGAKANAIVNAGAIIGIVMTDRGQGYNAKPNVTITDTYGTNANVSAVLCYSTSGAANLQSSHFYVVNDDFNIYKCLDNNNGARSIIKPTETPIDPFELSDGYVWKFMGSVPAGLRQKFVTRDQIPIARSISEAFYSSGEIKYVNVQDTGNNYTTASFSVVGDGYLQADPVYITAMSIDNTGAGYTAANVNIDPPLTGAVAWTANTLIYVGTLLEYDKNIYSVTRAGTTDSQPPVHTFGIVQNGTCGLKFEGRTATANVTVSGGNVTSIIPDGSLKEILISSGGSGYTYAPNITISGGGGVNANAYATLSNGSVRAFVINDIGKGYTSVPNVIIGVAWSANANVIIGQQIFNNAYIYTAATSGTLNTKAPTHITGTQQFGSANLTFAGIKAVAAAVLRYGAGYRLTPNIVIGKASGTTPTTNATATVSSIKSEAIIKPFIENGRIIRAIVEDGGTGYTYVTLNVAGDGSNAKFYVDFSEGDLLTLQSTIEILANDGGIHAIKVISGGYNYPGSTANVMISGDGVGATATADVLGGRVTKINVITPGTGYRRANVTINSEVGRGASARAILPPRGGHGKNILQELFAKALALYSNVSDDTNQGFDVNNDYRQFGIIKSVTEYDNNSYFGESIGSACWVITGSGINTGLFAPDKQVTSTFTNARFLIVASSPDGVLVQALDSSEPAVGETYQLETGQTFLATGIVKPEVNKYSGELIYIDNRLAFTPSTQQAVSLLTVFTF